MSHFNSVPARVDSLVVDCEMLTVLLIRLFGGCFGVCGLWWAIRSASVDAGTKKCGGGGWGAGLL